ncbi:PREDICTED: uncharacterized protein LOC109152267 [Ipomoea nil]|uniref:uncharacterized protein LOC109152267 n=1 Tax=Ipomoea nil TaxID=35883 RepID=UPI000901B954|nr:PREDICTED: uncharacterized protein LOC109152267 [Ipomoea nil]
MPSSHGKSAVIGGCKSLLLCCPLLVFFTLALLLPIGIWTNYCPSSSSSSLRLFLSSLYYSSSLDNESRSELESRNDSNSPTNLSHLVFGLLGSEKAWHHRRAYVESWWRPNATVGFLQLDKPPGAELLPWPPSSPPYRVSDNVSRVVEETNHVNPRVARMVHGIMETVRDAPQRATGTLRWVVMGDDDTIFLVDNLVDVLAQYDHTKYYYLGGHSEFIHANNYFSFKQAFGGGGIVLSFPLAMAMADGIMDCLKRYSHLNSADKTTGYCIADLGVNLSPHQGFHQIDMHGDISGFLSYHPNAPLISLHHFDMVNPIFPSMNRAESARHFMAAANSDQPRMLQQLLCFHRPRNWSFSVAWGYSANIYEKIMPRSYLQNPIETFQTWGPSPRPPNWIFDVRKRTTTDPCLVPHAFFLESVEEVTARDEIVATYRRSWRRGLPACFAGDGDQSADRISKIVVYSPVTKPAKIGRSECCDVTIDSVDSESAVIKTRRCMADDIIA